MWLVLGAVYLFWSSHLYLRSLVVSILSFFLFLSPFSNFHSIGSLSFILKLGVNGISINENSTSILLSCSPSFWLTSERCHLIAFYTPSLKPQFHVWSHWNNLYYSFIFLNVKLWRKILLSHIPWEVCNKSHKAIKTVRWRFLQISIVFYKVFW